MRIELIQIDLMHPEFFQYRVFTEEGKDVGSFNTLDEANDFVELNGGQRQVVIPWRKGIQARAE